MWFKLPEGTERVGVAGQEFVGDKDGLFEAPEEFETALAAANIMRGPPPEGWTPPGTVEVEEVVETRPPAPAEQSIGVDASQFGSTSDSEKTAEDKSEGVKGDKVP
jgi:hypothetical protein